MSWQLPPRSSIPIVAWLVSRYLVLLALLSLGTCILLVANYSRLVLDYIPFNGAFQTFNPVARLLRGEVPSLDFQPYLGLGPTYLTAFFTLLFGGNFSASQFSIYLLTLSSHFLVLFTLFFCTGFARSVSLLCAAAMVIVLSFIFRDIPLVNEIVGPGTSNLNLRSFLPYLISLILLMSWRFRQKSWLNYIVVGVLAGISPLWSNDYGLPSAAGLTILILLYLLRQDGKNALGKMLIFLLVAMVTFAAMGTLLTRGNLFLWLEHNFSGVAQDQFWYFLWWHNYNKIFSLADLFVHPLFSGFFFIYCLALSVVTIKGYWYSPKLRYLILIYLAITVISAGLLSSLGGTVSIRYYLPSVIVSFFIVPLALKLLFPPKVNSLELLGLRQIFFVILLIIYLVAPLTHLLSYYTYKPLPSVSRGFIKVEELGGWLSAKWQPSVEIAKSLQENLKAQAPHHRILSTYTSGMDVIIGAINPTNIDYIIHALGEKARKQYLDNFRKFQPKYITVLREDAYKWEVWARRTNWWFYREFSKNYKLVSATFYNLIWQRQEELSRPKYPEVSCRIEQQKANVVNLTVTSKSVSKGSYYVDLVLDYNLEVKPNFFPVIGKRGLVNIVEEKTANTRAIGQKNNRSYGIPPSHKSWPILLEHNLGEMSTIKIQGYPEKRSKLRVRSCQAEIVASLDAWTIKQELKLANFSQGNWKNGVLLTQANSEQARVRIRDTKSLVKLYPGMDLEFSGSGRRRITHIQGNQVWLNGAKLNPVTDGYPHPIQVQLR